MESEYDEEIMTPEEYLKNLDLEDFLNNKETREILEHCNLSPHILPFGQVFRLGPRLLFTASDRLS